LLSALVLLDLAIKRRAISPDLDNRFRPDIR
jgi:hypothetical protein